MLYKAIESNRTGERRIIWILRRRREGAEGGRKGRGDRGRVWGGASGGRTGRREGLHGGDVGSGGGVSGHQVRGEKGERVLRSLVVGKSTRYLM